MDVLEERALLSVGGATESPHVQAAAAQVYTGESGRIESAGHRDRSAVSQTSSHWSWLANTYWYVPSSNVPAVVLDTTNPTSPAVLPLADQTVFHITGFRDGYFWGVTVAQLGASAPSSSSMVGSVTPEGRVLLLFSPVGSSSGATMTEGIGRMVQEYGQWTMENQMFTSPGDQSSGESLDLGHWAYMVQTRPGLASWDSLPFVGVSVPQFLGNSTGQAPRP